MHRLINHFRLQPGDRIVEPKSSLRVVQHHSIYLGSDINGTDWIAENKIGFGVRVVTADQYFNGVIEITRIEKFNGNGYERKLAVQKALREVGKPYDLINFNCEHFANYVQHNSVSSKQVLGGAALGIALLIVLAAFAD